MKEKIATIDQENEQRKAESLEVDVEKQWLALQLEDAKKNTNVAVEQEEKTMEEESLRKEEQKNDMKAKEEELKRLQPEVAQLKAMIEANEDWYRRDREMYRVVCKID